MNQPDPNLTSVSLRALYKSLGAIEDRHLAMRISPDQVAIPSKTPIADKIVEELIATLGRNAAKTFDEIEAKAAEPVKPTFQPSQEINRWKRKKA